MYRRQWLPISPTVLPDMKCPGAGRDAGGYAIVMLKKNGISLSHMADAFFALQTQARRNGLAPPASADIGTHRAHPRGGIASIVGTKKSCRRQRFLMMR